MAVLFLVPGLVVLLLGGYLMVLAFASIGYPVQAHARLPSRRRIAVVVPAHDEELLVGRCVRSLREQTYPAELLRIVVVADNCTDATAAIAAEAGAEIMVRDSPASRGKGQALRWAVDRLLDEPAPPEAIVVVDADSIADRGLIAALAAEHEAGHEVVQADYELLESRSAGAPDLAVLAFLLFHRVRFRGRARLGMAANLVGNGMLISARVLRAVPWRAFTGVEDLEYSIQLRLAGIRPRFAPGAGVSGPGPASAVGATRQRLRWEGGRFYVVRAYLWRLLVAAAARRDARLLDAALDLATPPLVVLTVLSAAGAALTALAALAGLLPWWVLLPWALAMTAIAAFVVVGLRSAGAPPSTWRLLARAPGFIAWKLIAYLRLARGYDAHTWDRTDRVAS